MAADKTSRRFAVSLRGELLATAGWTVLAAAGLPHVAQAQVQAPVLYPSSASSSCTQTTNETPQYIAQVATCTSDVSQSGGLPFTASYSNGQDVFASPYTVYALKADISGSGQHSGDSFVLFYGSYGQPPNDTYRFNPIWTDGAPVTVTNQSDLAWTDATGSLPMLYWAEAINGELQYVYGGLGGGAIVGLSQGADGLVDDEPNTDNFNAGAGGSVTMTHNGTLSVTGNGSDGPYIAGLAGYSIGGNGAANKTSDTDFAGNGGDGGTVALTNNGAISIANADTTLMANIGMLALSLGGAPGALTSGDHANDYGPSGAGGTVTVDHYGTITGSAINTVGIAALSIGGDGGLDTGHGIGSAPGISGSGGTVDVTLHGGSSISLEGATGIGVLAASSVGPSAQSNVSSAISGGPVTVTIEDGATVEVASNGAFGIGVAAISTGSPDILRPFASSTVSPAGSGYSGAATITNDGSVTTSGSLAIGLLALSTGGSTVMTSSGEGFNDFGNYAPAVLARAKNAVTVTNTGSIVTNGGSAFGIFAASAGAGGIINIAQDAQWANATTPVSGVYVGGLQGTGANGGAVSVTHSGTITTGDGEGGGNLAIGILAQSLGGSGGTTGGPAAPILVGDSGGVGGNGSTVSVTTKAASTVTTLDKGAIGILAQSVGGGGGNGGNAYGVFVATGGAGGTGGNGGDVTVDLAGNGLGGISTSGHFAAGVVAQSVGGGGGNGGYGDTVGFAIAAAIGGSGGDGGSGGTVDVTNDTTITSAGNQSHGIVAQSVAGGGGNGGAANAYSAGVLTVSLAVGGSAGNGQSAGAVTVNNNYHIYTGCPDPGAADCGYAAEASPSPGGADAIGILAQSIGGGGGTGGAATAKSLSLPSGDIPVTFSASFASGGTGGAGGDGAGVTVNNAGEVWTGGDGAYGILAQSVGGGGGNGGDSTAAAYGIELAPPTIKLAIAHGGTGGSASAGGAVSVVNGASAGCTGCSGQIYTFGQSATGILAQSIGGGGGTGGTGNASASSPNLGGDGKSVTATFGIGGSGGDGGSGNTVDVTNDAGSSIVTVGPAAQGILAQSIGGGGGVGSGGQAGASGDTVEINTSVGGSGGAGGSADTVTVTNAGTIATGALYTNAADVTVGMGGDSVGILAQSIGGGGGVAGTSDAAATIDAAGQIEAVLNAPSNSYSADLGIGGNGGTAGSGGAVSVTNTGTISTIGGRAHGILAQSIGGGGGSGGAATSTSNSVLDPNVTAGTYTASVSVGGYGGAGGQGGSVDITNSGTIQTAGYAAHGLLLQSIGGGGGLGAEGTVDNTSTLGLGGGKTGNAGSDGDGGGVTLKDSGTVTTAGDDAYGILAQSIGAGGGHASAGCTNSADEGILGYSATLCLGNSGPGITVARNNWTDASDYTLQIGGKMASSGNGAAVAIEKTAGSIVTTGARAFAIAAQSIGGGGGLVAASSDNVTSAGFGDGTSSGTGGDVSISLSSGVAVTTYGDGAFGILAQSIGGGGGFAGDASQALSIGTVNVASSGTVASDAGSVSVTTGATIETAGANAHGLFLQSIGGAGGAVGGGSSLVAGNAWRETGQLGDGGQITVDQTGGSITTTGAGAIGIFAQSSGNGITQNTISITIGGAVSGGAGEDAAGIVISGGVSPGGTTLEPAETSTITIAEGGSVTTQSGAAGTAIVAYDGITQLTNNGTVTGSVDLSASGGEAAAASPAGLAASGPPPGLRGTFDNAGLFESGASVKVASLDNTGTLSPFGNGTIGTTAIAGDFRHRRPAELVVDIDVLAAGGPSDRVAVGGDAVVDGAISPVASTLLPGRFAVISAESLTGDVRALSSLLFDWDVANDGQTLSIAPDADFLPARTALSTNAASVGAYLQRTWDLGGSDALAPLYGTLAGLSSGQDYQALLSGLSGENRPSHVSDQIFAAREALDATFSCPVFLEEGTLLGEDECVWARVSGGVANRWGTPSYQREAVTFRMGGQTELAEGWFLGGTAAYGFDSTSGNGGSSNGDTIDGGIALKRSHGPWYFAAGLNVGYNWYDESRTVALGGMPYRLDSASSVLTVGGRLRAAYEFAFDAFYLRPFADLDLLFSHLPGHTESGPQGVALHLEEQNEFTVGFSPMLEAGGRLDLGQGWQLRPYAAAGLLLLSSDGFASHGRLSGAPAGAGTFRVESDAPDILGRVRLGAELYAPQNFDFRAEYDLQSGKDYLAQSGSLRLEYRF